MAGVRYTRRVPTCKKATTNKSLNPVLVRTRLLKKSHCQSVAAWIFKNSSQVPRPRLGPGSSPFAVRMFLTVLRETERTPSFFSSPKMRVYPQLFSRANIRISRRICSAVRRLPRGTGFCRFPRRSSRIQRRSVSGWTIETRWSSARPSFEPTRTNRFRSCGVTVNRRKPAAQQLVLDRQVADLSGKFFLRGSNQNQQQAAVDISHGDSAQVLVCQIHDFIFARRCISRKSCRREPVACRALASSSTGQRP